MKNENEFLRSEVNDMADNFMTGDRAILRYFEYKHLPPKLQEVSKQFSKIASFTALLPACEERNAALRKLLEAKDAAVRAALEYQG